MSREEAQEAAKLLFFNAGERKEQVERFEHYQVRTFCWLPMPHESKLQQESGTSPQRRWIMSPYRPISSQKLIPNQPALEQVWGAELKAQGEGTNRHWPGVSSENSSSHPQIIRRRVSIMRRGHAQRESKVLRQQLRQVEMNDGVTGDR